VSRRYDSPVRRQQQAETRERILAAASELVHGFATWDWRGLTFRAVAERAGVGERTVYRYFPSERQLHDAVMQRLEHEAGISYEEVDLTNLAEVAARILSSLSSFAVGESVTTPDDPTFVAVDRRRQAALRRAVGEAAPAWSAAQRDTVAALLDTVWNLPTYERLVGRWQLDHEQAVAAVGWLIARIVDEVEADSPPL
jgi:AcrR family transcriptional regulator